MNRAAWYTGLALLLLGGAVFVWKAWLLGLPMLPSDPEGLWRVELTVTARGTGRRGSVQAPLPTSGPGQVVFDERSVSDRLVFSIRSEGGQRVGVWSGRFQGVHEIVHGFRVQLSEVEAAPSEDPGAPPPEKIATEFGGSTADFPSYAPEMRDVLESLTLPPLDDPVGRVRTIFAFVTDEIATVPTGGDDAFLTLATREGNEEGKARLLVTLLRTAGIPARPVLGLQLRRNAEPRPTAWVEAWVGEGWTPLSPTDGFLGRKPADRLVLQTGTLDAVRATGVRALAHRYDALRQQLRPEELTMMMLPPSPLLSGLSLYRLPVRTQSVMRVLLVLPLGALIVALFRNMIGVPTFGTFMPILVALALRQTSLGIGLAMVGAVLAIGIFGRVALERLRILLVPRLSILLCLVILAVTALALAGRSAEVRDLLEGVLFPIVILTMLIERFSIVMAEQGMREALVRAAYTTLVAVAAYPVFQSRLAQHLMFGFPELVVCVMGLLVLIGAYTGYRLSDLIRFRSFARAEEGAGP